MRYFKRVLDLNCKQGSKLLCLSRIHLRVTDQTQQTGPNEFALHFEVVFVVC